MLPRPPQPYGAENSDVKLQNVVTDCTVAFQTLLKRFPHMKLELDRPEWADASMWRRLKSLPVAF